MMMNGIGGFGLPDPSQLAQMRNNLLKAADGDGDGAISQTEFSDKLSEKGMSAGRIEKMFGRLDSDGDGSISQAEGDEAKERIASRMAEGMGPMRHIGRSNHLSGALDAMQSEAGEDGMIAQSLFSDTLAAKGAPVERIDKLFGKLDSDSDGSLSQAEVEAAQEQIASRMEERLASGPMARERSSMDAYASVMRMMSRGGQAASPPGSQVSEAA